MCVFSVVMCNFLIVFSTFCAVSNSKCCYVYKRAAVPVDVELDWFWIWIQELFLVNSFFPNTLAWSLSSNCLILSCSRRHQFLLLLNRLVSLKDNTVVGPLCVKWYQRKWLFFSSFRLLHRRVSLKGNTVAGPLCVKWYQSEVRQPPFTFALAWSCIFDNHLRQQTQLHHS